MLVYMNNSLHDRFIKLKAANKLFTNQEVEMAIYDGAVLRLRPKLMTVMVDILGLLPVLLCWPRERAAT